MLSILVILAVLATSGDVSSQEHTYSKTFNHNWNDAPRTGEFVAHRGTGEWTRHTAGDGSLTLTNSNKAAIGQAKRTVLVGNGDVTTAGHELHGEFSHIKAAGFLDVRIRVDHSRDSGPTKATIIAEGVALDKIKPKIDEKGLSIGIDGEHDYSLNHQPVVLLEVPKNKVNSAEFTDASTGLLGGFDNNLFHLNANGSTQVHFQAQPKTLKASTTGEARLSTGIDAENVTFTATDRSFISSAAKHADVNLDGSADVIFSGPETLTGQCNGNCELNYDGSPQVTLSGSRAKAIVESNSNKTDTFNF